MGKQNNSRQDASDNEDFWNGMSNEWLRCVDPGTQTFNLGKFNKNTPKRDESSG
jgi:hypothetical protein